MALNPLEDDPARDERIKQRARHLWQVDGEPHGGDLEYWERARELVALEDSAGAGQLAVPSEAEQLSGSTQVVDESFIQDNLGEFPDRLSDQGEHAPTPDARLRRSTDT